jgi:hypothetical protein
VKVGDFADVNWQFCAGAIDSTGAGASDGHLFQWGLRMRSIACAFLILLASAVASRADPVIYNIDISSVPTVPGTGGQSVFGYTGATATPIWQITTPVYLLSDLGLPIGSEVNLGTLSVRPIIETDQYGDVGIFGTQYTINGVSVYSGGWGSCNLYSGNHCSDIVVPPPVYVPLIFSSDAEVQITYVNGSITDPPDAVAPPVPEPSTWAMLVIGFAGIGYFNRQRRLRASHL